MLDVVKGYMLYDFKKIRPDLEVTGIDISEYAIKNAKEEIKDRLRIGNAKSSHGRIKLLTWSIL